MGKWFYWWGGFVDLINSERKKGIILFEVFLFYIVFEGVYLLYFIIIK